MCRLSTQYNTLFYFIYIIVMPFHTDRFVLSTLCALFSILFCVMCDLYLHIFPSIILSTFSACSFSFRERLRNMNELGIIYISSGMCVCSKSLSPVSALPNHFAVQAVNSSRTQFYPQNKIFIRWNADSMCAHLHTHSLCHCTFGKWAARYYPTDYIWICKLCLLQ